MNNKQIYYNWRKINGYNAPVTVIISQRGLGKTFGCVKDAFIDFIEHGKMFVYTVETLNDVKTLSQDAGARFFNGVRGYLESSSSKRSKRLYEAIFGDTATLETGETDLVTKQNEKIEGATIKLGNVTAGYLLPINAYGNIKRNNFKDIGTIIFDEFIPEEIDIRHTRIARKVASVVESVARNYDVKIKMLGNAIRLDDVLLVKLGLANMRLGEIRKVKDEYGVIVVGHYVDPAEYAEYTQVKDKSVAGRLARLLGEDNLNKNTYKGALPPEYAMPARAKSCGLLCCVHGEVDSIRVNYTKDREELYITSDYGNNKNRRICFAEKYQTPVVQYLPDYKDLILAKYVQGRVKFQDALVYTQFRQLFGLEVN